MSIISTAGDQILTLHGPLAYGLVGGLVFAESALFVGFVLPGETAVLLGGVLAHQHRVSLAAIATIAVTAAVLGDTVGFQVGRRIGHEVLALAVFRKRTREVERGLQAVREHGGRAVFFARFIAFFRAVMPGLAGAARMPYRQFLLFNAAGGLVWAVGFTLLGFAAGASYERVESVIGSTSEVVLAAAALGSVVFVVGRRRRRHS